MNSPPVHPRSPARFQVLFWPVGIVLFFYFLSLIKGILLPFVVGILAAYFLDPAVRRLRVLNFSRNVSAAVITTVFFAIVIVLFIVLVPPIMHQLDSLLQNLPDYLRQVQAKYGYEFSSYLSRLNVQKTGAVKDALGNFGGTLVEWTGKVFSDVLRSSFAALNIVSLIFITPVVVFYLLRDWDRLVIRFRELLPRKHEKTIREQLRAIDRTLSGFIRGQTNVCLIMASYYGVLLSLAGLNFGLGLGIMSGFLLFIPFVGFAACFTLSMIVALFQFGVTAHLLVIAAVYLCGMFIEGSLLTPRLVGNEVGLHPVWIIFGMLSGAALFGFVGVLISVPVTSVIGVLVRFAIDRYMHSSLYLGI